MARMKVMESHPCQHGKICTLLSCPYGEPNATQVAKKAKTDKEEEDIAHQQMETQQKLLQDQNENEADIALLEKSLAEKVTRRKALNQVTPPNNSKAPPSTTESNKKEETMEATTETEDLATTTTATTETEPSNRNHGNN